MSTQEFKPGDRVRLREGTSPVSGHEGVTEFTVETVFAEGRCLKLVGVTGVRGRDRFEHAEPEDATDAYVEPEPLKEGAWVQVWAQLSFDPIDVSTYVRFTRADGGAAGGQWVRNDAIVRPDAGQVPPWVKPVEEPTTLGTVVTCEEGSVFVRVHAYGKQPWGRSGFNEFRSWDEIPAVERVVVGGAS